MNTITITKDDILDALESEPLTSGTYARETNHGCECCAVGAVMRHAVGRDVRAINATAIAALAGGPVMPATRIVPEGRWLNALSVVWEQLAWPLARYDSAAHEELRPDILAWAEEHIPEDYEVEVAVPTGVAQ